MLLSLRSLYETSSVAYTATLSAEQVSAAAGWLDAANRAAVALTRAEPSEGATVADVVARALVLARAPAVEGSPAGDALTRSALALARAPTSETLTDLDSAVRGALALLRAPAPETQAVVDATVRLLAAVRSTGEDALADALVQRLTAYGREPTLEALSTLDETVRGSLLLMRSDTETQSDMDDAARQFAVARQAVEIVLGEGDAGRSVTASREAVEAVSGDDAATRTVTMLRRLAETAITESLLESGNIRHWLVFLAESAGAGDVLARTAALQRATMEAVATVEAANRRVANARAALDTIAPAPASLGRAATLQRGTLETVATLESAARDMRSVRAVLDVTSTSGDASRAAMVGRKLTEALTTVDQATRRVATVRLLAEAVTEGEAVTRAFARTVRLTEAVDGTAVVERHATLARRVLDALGTLLDALAGRRRWPRLRTLAYVQPVTSTAIRARPGLTTIGGATGLVAPGTRHSGTLVTRATVGR